VSVQDRHGNAPHAHFTLFVVECEAAHTGLFQILAQVCQRNDRLVREPLTDACRGESVPGEKKARSAATSLRPCRMPDAGRSQPAPAFGHIEAYIEFPARLALKAPGRKRSARAGMSLVQMEKCDEE
jgi:hypothetical protein